jgi:hypothetical protein
VFVIVPAAVLVSTVTTIEIVALDPALIAPSARFKLVVPDQEPCDIFTELSVVPGGRASRTVTGVAWLGPEFATTSRYLSGNLNVPKNEKGKKPIWAM